MDGWEHTMAIREAIGALYWVLIGTFLGFRLFSPEVDPLFDKIHLLLKFLGPLLIWVGLAKLLRFKVTEQYSSTLRFVTACALLTSVEVIAARFVSAESILIDATAAILGVARLVACVLFCRSMIQLCTAYSLERSAKKWRVTRVWFLWTWTILIGGLSVVSLLAGASQEGVPPWVSALSSSTRHAPAMIFPIALLLILPMFRFLAAMTSMAREAGEPEALRFM